LLDYVTLSNSGVRFYYKILETINLLSMAENAELQLIITFGTNYDKS